MFKDEHLQNLIRHYKYALLISPNREDTHYKLAELYYEHGDLAQSIETCQKALNIGKKTTWPLEILTKILTRLGFKGDDIDQLLEIFANTATLEKLFLSMIEVSDSSQNQKAPTDERTWKDIHCLSYQSIQAENFEHALDFCAEAIYREPSLPFPHLIAKYWLLSKPELLDSLLELYTKAVQVPRIHRLAHTVFGDILTARDRLSEAIASYQKAWPQPNKKAHAKQKIILERTSRHWFLKR